MKSVRKRENQQNPDISFKPNLFLAAKVPSRTKKIVSLESKDEISRGILLKLGHLYFIISQCTF